ncbi:MAG: glycosyltransferase family 2 protein [Terracidiphilus sp.]
MPIYHKTSNKLAADGGQTNLSSAPNLTVIVLTLNEEKHIARCLESIRGLAQRVIVVDSESTDRTRNIAADMGADIYVNKFINHSTQFNWGLDNAKIRTEWVMRLDADEVITPQLSECLKHKLPLISSSTVGLSINRQIHFMGKWIKHGSIYPIRHLRIWRNGKGRCERRWMDEHIVVQGNVSHQNADIADINLNNISWWVNKHNQYSIREAIDLLRSEELRHNRDAEGVVMSRQARAKRWVKYSVYAHLPLGLRSAAYFCYRYILRFGFLDGWQGLVFHFMQGFWYRFLVDVKVFELKAMMEVRKQTLQEVVKEEYGYDL